MVALSSCEKSNLDDEIDLTANDWKIIKIKSPGESTYLVATEDYVFNFVNDSIFTFNLDVNGCGGDYEIISKGNIEFGWPYCTMVCCDSDFADKLLELIPDMTRYFGLDNKLVLQGQGEIIFSKVN